MKNRKHKIEYKQTNTEVFIELPANTKFTHHNIPVHLDLINMRDCEKPQQNQSILLKMSLKQKLFYIFESCGQVECYCSINLGLFYLGTIFQEDSNHICHEKSFPLLGTNIFYSVVRIVQKLSLKHNNPAKGIWFQSAVESLKDLDWL